MGGEFGYRYSGYNEEMDGVYNELLVNNKYLFQVSYGFYNNNEYILCTHAGIDPGWLKRYFEIGELSVDEIPDNLNQMYQDPLYIRNFGNVSFKRGGDYNSGSPIWSDQKEWKNLNEIKGGDKTVQIFGHTRFSRFTDSEIPFHYKHKNENYWVIDCIYEEKEKNFYLTLNDSGFNIVQF